MDNSIGAVCPHCGTIHPLGGPCPSHSGPVNYPGEWYHRWAPVLRAPHRCPICEGRGTVPAGFYTGTAPTVMLGGTAAETCRGCGGAGIIWG